MFDGPNILLKLHGDRFNIAIFIFVPFGLKLPIHAYFAEFLFCGYDWVPLGIGHRRNLSKTRVLGHQTVEKSLKIGLAVIRHNTAACDRHPATLPQQRPRLRIYRAGKKAISCLCKLIIGNTPFANHGETLYAAMSCDCRSFKKNCLRF